MCDVNPVTRRQPGQSIVEYALILSLVVVIVVVALSMLGVTIGDLYCGTLGIFGVEPQDCHGGQILWEDFEDLTDWNFTDGDTWDNSSGQLCTDGGGEHRGFTGDEEMQDYVVTVHTANLTYGNGYGVYFRASNEPNINAYVFQYDPGYGGGEFLFRRVTNGSESPPIARAAAPGFQWANVTREVRVEVEGDTFTAFVDGVQVLAASDSTYTSGRAGLRTWDSTDVCFDDFEISEVD